MWIKVLVFFAIAPIQPTISLEMPVPSRGHYGFHSFPVVDWFCLFIYCCYATSMLDWPLTFTIHMLRKGFVYIQLTLISRSEILNFPTSILVDKGNNKITELRTILQRESQNSLVYKQTKSVNNRKTVKTVMTPTWYRHF
jgi:hypothetical protein